MLLQVDNEDMTNTKVDNLMVVNLMVVSIQGGCRPVTLQACYFDILKALYRTLQSFAVTLDQKMKICVNLMVVYCGVGHVFAINLK